MNYELSCDVHRQLRRLTAIHKWHPQWPHGIVKC